MLLLAVNCFASVSVYSDTDTVFINRNASIGVPITIENHFDEEVCLDLSGETDSSYVNAVPSLAEVCLPANSHTNLALSISTIDAPNTTYSATVLAESDGFGNATHAVEVKILSESTIEITPFDADVCRGERDYFSVLIKNNSSGFKNLRLWADNEMLLPYFSPNEITLDAFEDEYAKVYVHTSRSMQLGNYRVSLFAESDSEQAKKMGTIRVKECLDEDLDFSVDVSNGCQYLEKGEEERVSYTITNLSDEEIDLRVAVLSDLPVDYDSRITIEENETRTFRIDVAPRDSDETGRHDLELVVWDDDSGETGEASKCVYVRKTGASVVEVINNNLDIAQCLSEVFTVLVKNTGDFEEDYHIRAVGLDEDTINVSISDERFELEENEQKYVYVSVTTSEDTELGTYEFDLIIEADSDTFTETLKFNVLEERVERAQDLEIVSFPTQVTVDEETGFIVSIRNNSDDEFDALVRIVGLPQGASSDKIEGISLEANETAALQLFINAKGLADGIYSAQIEARNSEFATTEDFEFIVNTQTDETDDDQDEDDDEEPEDDQFLAGLFTAGSNVMLGLITLAIVISLILLIGKAIGGYQKNEIKPKEAWMGVKK
jgi:uncharacterized membrane protein